MVLSVFDSLKHKLLQSGVQLYVSAFNLGFVLKRKLLGNVKFGFSDPSISGVNLAEAAFPAFVVMLMCCIIFFVFKALIWLLKFPFGYLLSKSKVEHESQLSVVLDTIKKESKRTAGFHESWLKECNSQQVLPRIVEGSASVAANQGNFVHGGDRIYEELVGEILELKDSINLLARLFRHMSRTVVSVAPLEIADSAFETEDEARESHRIPSHFRIPASPSPPEALHQPPSADSGSQGRSQFSRASLPQSLKQRSHLHTERPPEEPAVALPTPPLQVLQAEPEIKTVAAVRKPLPNNLFGTSSSRASQPNPPVEHQRAAASFIPAVAERQRQPQVQQPQVQQLQVQQPQVQQPQVQQPQVQQPQVQQRVTSSAADLLWKSGDLEASPKTPSAANVRMGPPATQQVPAPQSIAPVGPTSYQAALELEQPPVNARGPQLQTTLESDLPLLSDFGLFEAEPVINTRGQWEVTGYEHGGVRPLTSVMGEPELYDQSQTGVIPPPLPPAFPLQQQQQLPPPLPPAFPLQQQQQLPPPLPPAFPLQQQQQSALDFNVSLPCNRRSSNDGSVVSTTDHGMLLPTTGPEMSSSSGLGLRSTTDLGNATQPEPAKVGWAQRFPNRRTVPPRETMQRPPPPKPVQAWADPFAEI